MRIIFLAYILVYTTFVFGQKNTQGAVFASNAENGDVVLVKWLYSEVYHPQGFDVHRSNGDDNWQKINTSPIKLNKNASDANFDKETKQLFKAIRDTPHDEFSTSIARAFVMIKSIYNNELATDIGVMYADKTAQNGKRYKYKVTIANQTTTIGISNELSCGAFSNSFSPKEIVVERNKKFISFSWKPDVYSYYGVDVYRKEIGTAEYVKMTNVGPITIDIKTQRKYTVSDVFFSDTTMDNTKGYMYKLMSINYFGQVSEFTEEISVPIKDFIPPATPYSFKVRPYSVEGFAKLTWEAADEADLGGFNVYTSEDPDGTFKKVNEDLIAKTERSYNVLNLPVGGHYFVIAAVDLSGNTTTTGMMFGEMRDVIPPAAPTNLETNAESGKITLSWNANSEGDLMGYYIQKSLSDSNNLDNHYVIMNSEICKETSFEVLLPKNVKNEFVYRIVAVDTLYNVSKPSINSFAQMPDVIPPKTPVLSNVSISEDTTTIVVSWLANVDSDLEGYNLLRRLNKDTAYTQVNYALIPKDVTAYKDRSAELGSQYVYAVKAVDNSGNESTRSNDFNFSMKSRPTNAEVIVTNSGYSTRKKQISLQWKWQGEQELKGYVVYMMSDEGILKPFSGLNASDELKIKQELVQKKTFEIRAYTVNGEIVKSKLIVINPGNI